ncbi:hypothetical protein [Halalkalibaculum sp. DA384]|uniref:hypothetical protein n=1 Tax=Halalkalibaculum sp. DA384 TaxID=3373606 RepID=UPI0037553570
MNTLNKTHFEVLKERFLNHRVGVAIASILVIIGGISAFLSNVYNIRNRLFPSYDLAISANINQNVDEFEKVPLKLEVILSGDAGKVVDDATITLEILDANGHPMNLAQSSQAFILPEEPIQVPPLTPEAPQREIELSITPQRSGSYTIVARVSAGGHVSQTHSRISVLRREIATLQQAAPENAPLLVVDEGIAKSEIPLAELDLLRILIPEHIDDLGYFNSTLWLEKTAVLAAGGVTWRVSSIHNFGDIIGEISRFEKAIENPQLYSDSYELQTHLADPSPLVLVGDSWYELSIIGGQRIGFVEREETCSQLHGVFAGKAPIDSTGRLYQGQVMGKRWLFNKVDLEIIEGPWDCGATGMICSYIIQINGEPNLVSFSNSPAHKFVDKFPVRIEHEGGHVIKVHKSPISVELCKPMERF